MNNQARRPFYTDYAWAFGGVSVFRDALLDARRTGGGPHEKRPSSGRRIRGGDAIVDASEADRLVAVAQLC
jgi:hypothetical protein